MCALCNYAPESILHAICDCPKNDAIWSPSNLAAVIPDAPRSSVIEFLIWMKAHSSQDDFLSLCTTLWAVWFIRNKSLFTTKACDPIALNLSFHKLVQDYNSYAMKTHIPLVEPLLKFQSWHPPLDDWVKINFDVFVPSNVQRGLEIVFRDKECKILLAGVRTTRASWSAEISEMAAALFGVEVVVRLGYRLMHIEGDAINVVRAIDHRNVGCSYIHMFLD